MSVSIWSRSGWVVLFVLANATPSAAADKARPTPNPSPSPNLIVVNGLTGAVWSSSPSRVFKPSDDVTIRVSPADLIHYTYAIEPTDEALSVPDVVIGGAQPASPPSKAPEEQVDVKVETAKLETDAIKAIDTLDFGLSQAERIPLENKLAACGPQRAGGQPQTCDWPAELSAKALQDLREPLIEVNTRRASLLIEVDESTKLSRQDIDDLRKRLGTVREKTESALKAIGVRIAVIQLHSSPEMELLVHLKSDSRRYTAKVTRTLRNLPPVIPAAPAATPAVVAQAAASDNPGTGTKTAKNASDAPAADAEQMAIVAFEAHARARFNVALGFGFAHQSLSVTYGIVDSVVTQNGAQKVIHKVEKTSSSSNTSTIPFGTIGIYLTRHDVDTIERPNVPRPILVVGAQLDGSKFLGGLGLDWAQGFQLQVGVTRYDGVRLADGWVDGQEVPSKDSPDTEKGKPVVSTPPTITTAKMGWYAGLTFRPTIFKTLWDSVKK